MNMHKLILATATSVLAWGFIAGAAFAQNSKFSAIVDKVTITAEDDETVTSSRMTTVKIPGNKALLLGVSSQIGIETDTKVKGKKGGGGSATATGDVSVSVAVVPAGTPFPAITPADFAEPGEITFAMREQELSAVLGGVLESCEVDLGTGEFTADDCEFTDEEIGLLLKTLAAHHFNFIWEAPATGEYDVWLLVAATAATDTADTDPGGDNEASALVVVGPTVLSVEEVRAAKGGIEVID